MDMLTQLGVNETLAIQLGMFLVVFVALKYLLFGPYFAAFNERQARTLGKTELAERYLAESRAMEETYALRAREANDRYREVFDKSRAETNKQYEQLVSDARNQSKVRIEEMRAQIRKEIQGVQTQLTQEVPAVSQLINHKLIGKEFSA